MFTSDQRYLKPHTIIESLSTTMETRGFQKKIFDKVRLSFHLFFFSVVVKVEFCKRIITSNIKKKSMMGRH